MVQLVVKDKVISSGKKPLVCVPLMGRTDAEVMTHMENIMKEARESNIDIIEFRGDFYDGLEDMKMLTEVLTMVRENAKDKILLFTIRSPREGGEKRDYSIMSIDDINRFVIKNRLADMVDVELFSLKSEEKSDTAITAYPPIIKLAKEHNVKIIMSNHDFDKTPSKETIVNRLVSMQGLGADIAKIAVMPQGEEDLLTLLMATYDMKHSNTPVVTMSMGSKGALSRMAGEIFGSAITFGAVGEISAPGQIPVQELNCVLDNIHTYCVDR